MGLVKGEIRGEGEAECVVWCGGKESGSCVHSFFCFICERGDLPPNAWSL